MHHIQKGSSESGTTSTKTPILRCNRCCDKVRIHSSNVAAEFYPHLLGIYEVLDTSVDCYPPTYKWAQWYKSYWQFHSLFLNSRMAGVERYIVKPKKHKRWMLNIIIFCSNYFAEGNTPGESIMTPPLPGAGWGRWRARSVLMTSSTGESGVRRLKDGSRTPPSLSDVLRSYKYSTIGGSIFFQLNSLGIMTESLVILIPIL